MIKKLLPLILILVLAACSASDELSQASKDLINTQVALSLAETQSIQSIQLEATQLAYKSPTPNPTETFTLTPTDLPTLTFTPTPTPTETDTPEPTFTEIPTETPISYIPENAIFIYATILGTGGNVGCGDDLIKLYSGHIRTGDVKADLTTALNTLFSAGSYAAGFYNATYPSNLQVVDVTMSTGTAKVYLDGNYVVPKDSCDASRYRSQVWATGLQFEEVTHFIPFVGSKLLGDRLAVYSDGGG
jgi:hypothetical protein